MTERLLSAALPSEAGYLAQRERDIRMGDAAFTLDTCPDYITIESAQTPRGTGKQYGNGGNVSLAWESKLPEWAQSALSQLRQEVHFANLGLAKRNQQIRELKSELRMLRRVMRLKNESLCMVSAAEQPPTVRSVGVGFEDH